MKKRGHWLVPHVSVYVIHQAALVPLWREASPLKRYDSVPLLEGSKDDLLSGRLDGKPPLMVRKAARCLRLQFRGS